MAEEVKDLKRLFPRKNLHSRIPRSLVIILFFLFTALNLILLAPKHTQSATKNNPLNILLITVDTLRADYLGCYGSKTAKTPNIDQLAKEGILFKYAFAHNVVTLPSHVNILTGTYPIYHGVRDNAGYRLGENFVVFSEILKKNGYKTGAFVGSLILDSRYGLNRGFDFYDDYYGDTNVLDDFAIVERIAEKVIEPAEEWLEKHKRDSWFCWVHLWDPHFPYYPPQPFKDEYPNDPYAGEVAYTDFAIGNLFDFLKKSGMDKDCLIILTADHGESLGEYGERTHGIFAYNCTLHVPLIFYQPESFQKYTIINKRVGHIDIMPTVLDLLKIKIPKEVQGRSLLPLIKNPKKWKVDDTYFESMSPNLNRNWAPLQGILSEQYKYIDLPIVELYDMSTDFQENSNLSESKRSIIQKLDEKLAKLIREHSSEESQKMKRIEEDAETLEKLRALGYVGGSSQEPMKKIYTKEDDPKRLIELDAMSQEAMGYFSEGNPQRAVELFQEILELRPTLTLTYSNLSYVYHETGEIEKAIQILEKALSMGLENEGILTKLGAYYQETEDLKRSIEILETAVERYPQYVEGFNFLGISYWRAGRYDEAIKTLEKLLALDSSYASGYNNLGSVYLSKKQYDLAVVQFNKAIKYDPKLAGPYNGLGVIYANKGDNDQAMENWKKAVELDNKQYDALYNLGILLTQMDRFEEAIKYLEQFVNTAPRYRYADDIEKLRKLISRLKQVIK